MSYLPKVGCMSNLYICVHSLPLEFRYVHLKFKMDYQNISDHISRDVTKQNRVEKIIITASSVYRTNPVNLFFLNS